MTQENTEKVALFGAPSSADCPAEIRAALRDASSLRREAESVLAALPAGCDLLAWSPEGFAIAAVASVVAEDTGRRVDVHRASLLTPFAPSGRRDRWTWVAVEELLGLGPARSWAAEWAKGHGGRPHRDSVTLVH